MATFGAILAAYGTAMFLLSLWSSRRARRFYVAAKHFYEMASEDARQLSREHEAFRRDLDAAIRQAKGQVRPWMN